MGREWQRGKERQRALYSARRGRLTRCDVAMWEDNGRRRNGVSGDAVQSDNGQARFAARGAAGSRATIRCRAGARGGGKGA